MGLLEDIENVLRRNDGKAKIELIYKSVGNKYAKSTILEFLNQINGPIIFDGEDVILFKYHLELLKGLVSSYIAHTRIEGDTVYYLVAYFLFIKRQFPEIETEDFKDSYRVILRNGYNEIKEPDFSKFSEYHLDILIRELDSFSRTTTLEKLSDSEFYRFTSEFYELFINSSIITRGQFTTPDTLIQLICELIPMEQPLRVYNPAAGMLKLLTAISLKARHGINAIASEINLKTYEIGGLFAATNGFRLDFNNGDSIYELDQFGPNTFDIVVSVPPFNAKGLHRDGNYESYNDVALDIISSSLYKLTENGKAIFLVVDGVLFSQSRNQKRFRREIIESKMLQTVISLPVNLFYPFTAVKTSVLIFDKRQNLSSVRFIDASAKSFYTTTQNKMISLETEKIVELLKFDSEPFVELNDERKLVTKSSLSVDYKILKSNNYSLNISEYLILDAQNTRDIGNVRLGDILKTMRLPLNQGFDIPYIRITDLNGGYINGTSKLGRNKTRTRGRVLEDSALLIGTVGGSPKPTWYNINNAVEISTNIAVFKLDLNVVELDYLLQELNSTYIKEQFDFMAVGSTSLRHLKIDDLLNTIIKLPSLEEQRRILKERGEFLKQQRIPERETSNSISGGEIIKTLKHEIGNILKGPSGFLELLPKFLANNRIDLELPSANYKTARSIGERITSARQDITKVNQIMETMTGILLAESSVFNPEYSEILSYIRKKCEKLAEHQKFDFYIGANGNYITSGHIFAEIDKTQFDHLIDNIVINAIEHGLTALEERFILLVNVLSVESEDSRDIEIHIMNNGNRLPSDFSIDDYIRFSKKQVPVKGRELEAF